MKQSQLGIIGMGVMGKSLALNVLGKGFSVSVYNRSTPTEEDIIPTILSEAQNPNLQGFTGLNDFVHSLEKPRKILLMVTAGTAVESVLENLTPMLSKGDLVMDGGNSNYRDTQRREHLLLNKGLHYLGIGISGGEKGALEGPSLMAGGIEEAYRLVSPILESIAAKDLNLQPCVSLLGPNGAGHFIKTIHNGIEYAEMQLLAEVFAILHPYLSQDEICDVFQDWNKGETQSFLLETTLRILQTKENGEYLLPKVMDIAKGKGTGNWSSEAALAYGVPATLMVQAVMARALSTRKKEREDLQKTLNKDLFEGILDTDTLRTAYQFARVINHEQGLYLIQRASQEEGWDINLNQVTRVWSNGCILRSSLMEEITKTHKDSLSLFESPVFREQLSKSETAVNEVLLVGMEQRTALPCLSGALQYWYGMTTASSSANLIQAQRDAFGAHTFQRVDRPTHEYFSSKWNPNG